MYVTSLWCDTNGRARAITVAHVMYSVCNVGRLGAAIIVLGKLNVRGQSDVSAICNPKWALKMIFKGSFCLVSSLTTSLLK